MSNISPKAPSLSKERKQELFLFLKKYKLDFKDINLLNTAFTHKSYAHDYPYFLEHNERLEFLGDSVLALVVTRYLYKNYPDKTEGELSRIRSVVVSEKSLSSMAEEEGFGKFLLVGRGEELTGGRRKKPILADASEAIFAAIYLDNGFEKVEDFILKLLEKSIIDTANAKIQKDYKSLLQEYAQKKYKMVPTYTLISKKGPEHDRTFLMKVSIKTKEYAKAIGKSKKEAELLCAKQAYKQIFNLQKSN